MKPMRSLLQVLLLCLAAWTPLALGQVSPDIAEQLMRKSGLWAQLGTLGPQMRQGLEQGLSEAGAAVPDAARQRLLAEAVATFTAEHLQATARRELAEAVRPVHVAALTAWFDSPAGQAVARAEAAAAADERDPEVVIRQGAVLMAAAAPGRRELIARVVEAAGAARALTDVVTEIAVASRAAVLRAVPAAPLSSAQTLRAELDAQRPQMLEGFRAAAFALFAVTYKDLPDEQLQAYVRMMGTSAGEHFNDAGENAFQAAMLQALGSLAKAR